MTNPQLPLQPNDKPYSREKRVKLDNQLLRNGNFQNRIKWTDHAVVELLKCRYEDNELKSLFKLAKNNIDRRNAWITLSEYFSSKQGQLYSFEQIRHKFEKLTKMYKESTSGKNLNAHRPPYLDLLIYYIEKEEEELKTNSPPLDHNQPPSVYIPEPVLHSPKTKFFLDQYKAKEMLSPSNNIITRSSFAQPLNSSLLNSTPSPVQESPSIKANEPTSQQSSPTQNGSPQVQVIDLSPKNHSNLIQTLFNYQKFMIDTINRHAVLQNETLKLVNQLKNRIETLENQLETKRLDDKK